ncbi:MAG: ABC transporter permease [Clostridia bacterium]|nr:ABC transporter permease [Clostridia bacterium]
MAFLIQKTLLYAIPLLIVALAGVFAERSGIINIALDGIMIFGSFVGAIAVYGMQYIFPRSLGQLVYLIGMAVAALSGAVYSLLLSYSAVKLKADQTIGGTALNMLAPAFVLFLNKILFNQNRLEMPNGSTTSWFMIHNNTGIGIVDGFFDKVYISTYIIIALFAVLSVILYKTKFGLRLRACGEHPQAADSLGINVYKMRYAGTTISGALAGLGGYVYVATTSAGSVEGTVAGMGFLALAIMIFGNWKPGGIVLGSLLFGLLKCISASYSTLDINGDGIYWLKEIGVSRYLYQLLPYLITLVVLALTCKKSRAPKAEGIPYDKGLR